MKKSLFFLAGVVSFISVAIPVFAHHSFAAQYDRAKQVALTGPVTKVDWINPHARFFMDVKDASGKVVNWEIELGSPNGLMRRGWTRNSLKIGAAGYGEWLHRQRRFESCQCIHRDAQRRQARVRGLVGGCGLRHAVVNLSPRVRIGN